MRNELRAEKRVFDRKPAAFLCLDGAAHDFEAVGDTPPLEVNRNLPSL